MTRASAILRYCLPLATLLSTSAPGSPREKTIILPDQQPYFQGSYGAYASPWSIFFDKTLQQGVDYADSITIRPTTFPNGTIIDTRWPESPPTKTGVWGYHALSYGNYDGGKPPRAVVPRQVKDIAALRETFDFSWSGSARFNLLNEFYLTSAAGRSDAKVVEIGFLLHAPASSVDFVNAGTFIGNFREANGRMWTINRTRNYITIMPVDAQDCLRDRINIKVVLDFLVRKKVLTGLEWFNGIAFGTEPTSGAGTTRIAVNHWDVEYR